MDKIRVTPDDGDAFRYDRYDNYKIIMVDYFLDLKRAQFY